MASSAVLTAVFLLVLLFLSFWPEEIAALINRPNGGVNYLPINTSNSRQAKRLRLSLSSNDVANYGRVRKPPLATFGQKNEPGYFQLNGVRVNFSVVFPAREPLNRDSDLSIGIGYGFGQGHHYLLGNNEWPKNSLSRTLGLAYPYPEAIDDEAPLAAQMGIGEIQKLIEMCVGVAREDADILFDLPDQEEKRIAEELAKVPAAMDDFQSPDLKLVRAASTRTGLSAELKDQPSSGAPHPIRRVLTFIFAPLAKFAIFLFSFCPFQLENPRVIFDFMLDLEKENKKMAILVNLEFRPNENKIFVVIKNETESMEELEKAYRAETRVRISKKEGGMVQTDWIELSSDGKRNESGKTNIQIMRILRDSMREAFKELKQDFNWALAAQLIGRQLLSQDVIQPVNELLRKHGKNIAEALGITGTGNEEKIIENSPN